MLMNADAEFDAIHRLSTGVHRRSHHIFALGLTHSPLWEGPMSIICGTDFSARGSEAIAVATALATRCNEPLSVVHVAPASTAVDERLHTEADYVRQHGIAVQTERLEGAPDEAITAYAERSGARLVVISSLGHRSESRWLLGSVAERVARTSPVGVLVARGAAAFDAWARSERPLRVLVGVDFSATSDAALQWVGTLRQCGPCDVIAAHVYWPPDEYRRLGFHGPIDLSHIHPEVQRVLTRHLQARVGELPGAGALEVCIWTGAPPAGDHLIQLAEREHVDLIVVGTHQRSGLSRVWHGSIALGVLCGAGMSVACIPAPSRVEPAHLLPHIRRVVVATDLSELGDRAVPYAYALLNTGGTVHLLHVIEPHTLPNPLYAHYVPGRMPTPEEEARQRNDLVARLQALVPAEAAAKGIDTQTEVVEEQRVAEAICATADRLGADLVCLSTHGRSGLSKAIAGSVTQEVMTQSRRPLLVIRPPRD
jgi:nucleotide-binding universal stress UspA family protein